MLRKALIVLAAAIVALCVTAAMRPSQYRITRETTIAAPASLIWPKVVDLHQWLAWSPWEKLDPNMKRTFSGPPAGPGASYAWDSNVKKAGAGSMTIIESKPLQLVRIELDFLRPMKSVALTTITLTPSSNGQTKVTWEMTGQNNFMAKIFFLFTSMDKMVGPDFESGLAQLKTLCETQTSH